MSKFKPGDMARVVRKSHYCAKVGDIEIIESGPDTDGDYFIEQTEHNGRYVTESQVELVVRPNILHADAIALINDNLSARAADPASADFVAGMLCVLRIIGAEVETTTVTRHRVVAKDGAA